MLIFIALLVLSLHAASRRADTVGDSIASGPALTAFGFMESYKSLASSLHSAADGNSGIAPEERSMRFETFASYLDRLGYGEEWGIVARHDLQRQLSELQAFLDLGNSSIQGERQMSASDMADAADRLGKTAQDVANAIEADNNAQRHRMISTLEGYNHKIWIFAVLLILSSGALIYSVVGRNRQLTARTEALTHSEARLREVSHFRQQFLANMSHEFRTPLNAIQGFSQAILYRRDDIPREQILSYVAMIEKSSHDLAGLTENALELSQIDSGDVAVTFRDVDFSRLLESAIKQSRAIASRRGIPVRSYIAEDWTVRCDRDGIRRCLGNILSNAVKFSGDGSPVDLFAYRRDAHLMVIEIRDRGCGIAARELENIWLFYTRTSLTRNSEKEGAGLGLAFVKSLVDAHDGFVEVESTEGEGTTVRLCFPATMIQATAPMPAAASRAASLSSASA